MRGHRGWQVNVNARSIGLAILVTAAALAAAILSPVGPPVSDQPVVLRATVTIGANASSTRVPPSYLGLSTEYWTLPLYAPRLPLLERVLSMLRVPGDGPLVLRIGGDSADRTFWDPRRRPLPSWAFPVTPAWMRQLARLVHRVGLRLIVDLNLVTGSPDRAAALAHAVQASLPRHTIAGFEVGNEPDIYVRSAWQATTGGTMAPDTALPAAVTGSDYIADFRLYAAALRRAAPRAAWLGPALANPRAHESWTAALIASHPPGLREITAHRYAYSGCVHRRSHRFATIPRLLSPRATTGLVASLTSSIAAAHRAGLPFRLTELNSVNCGGRRGVSNSFATALWAPSALFALLSAGVNGVNLHVRADTINAPFALGAAGLTARPLLYGLIGFVRTLGSNPRLVAAHLVAPRSLHLSAWAVRANHGRLHVLVIDDGRRAVHLRLALPTRGPAVIERLRARSPRATSGVTLDGQWLGADGRWHGTRTAEIARPMRRGYQVTVAPFSAALLTASLRW